jgi:hypothetical protein
MSTVKVEYAKQSKALPTVTVFYPPNTAYRPSIAIRFSGVSVGLAIPEAEHLVREISDRLREVT